MTGKRLRLNTNERAYITRLVREDNKHHQEMVSKTITKLLSKLEDDATDARSEEPSRLRTTNRAKRAQASPEAPRKEAR